MTDRFFSELKRELQQGVHKKGHSFRYGTLATVGLETMPRLRTVVLRKVSEDLKLTFFTDKRSKKLIHIKENNKVSMLFYDPKQLLQVKVEGLANSISDAPILKKYWNAVQPNSRKDYTTAHAPGSSISNPDKVDYLNDENYFCILEIEPFRIEYLKLKRPNHLRVQFSKKEGEWVGEFLVP
ncbi:MAG: pyridoxamine 5'-phosphate oxidase family protein [Maribacter sp.]|uniref:pyridoxamine 5'-phosphate oxidase family protein n=1 Tax=Maribacter sp. TaxID=1897614 RepID=UPI00329A307B